MMGLTYGSAGFAAGREDGGAAAVALAGNPNVGKSTIFNRLTGLRQHTGNWSGKTVGCACGRTADGLTVADLPGTYSLVCTSAEEELARDWICFGGAQRIVVVCDAGALRRSLQLALQVMEAHGDAAVCVNMCDEARKNGVTIDPAALSREMGVPVCAVSAAGGEGMEALERMLHSRAAAAASRPVTYDADIEAALAAVTERLGPGLPHGCARFCALAVLRGDASAMSAMAGRLDLTPAQLENARAAGRALLREPETLDERISLALSERAERLAAAAGASRSERALRADRILTHPLLGLPVMLLLLAAALWITIAGANVPSGLLSTALFGLGERLEAMCGFLPDWAAEALFDGIWRTTAYVASVMLPPMAIFFPLFTLLEDSGYLPRAAFNLDGAFQRAGACGKQALTMAMGLGCNAAGIVGCRIIDSRRERMIAMLTNAFMPCNGRFPALIAVITVFFAPDPLTGALMLSGLLVMGVTATLLVSRLLSATLLRGMPSFFTLELPPYRLPDVGQVLLRSVIDRTVFVLGRALAVAAPAGLLIWALARLGLLAPAAGALDPVGRALGLDGVILLGFLLGLPANETVIPVILMCLMQRGVLEGYASLAELGTVLTAAGWTEKTALCFLVFTMFHWPCSTALLTLKKESGAWRWAALGAALPTICGALLCAAINLLWPS